MSVDELLLDDVLALGRSERYAVARAVLGSLAPGEARVIDAMLETLTTLNLEGDTDGDREAEEDDPDRTAYGADSAEAPRRDRAAAAPAAGPDAAEGWGDYVPDSITPVIGWRTWRLDSEGRLRSWGSDDLWKPGEPLRARCRRRRSGHALRRCTCPQETAPARRCDCGIYAAQSIEQARKYLGGNGVIGRVALWGTVIEHEDGHRAEYAYPAALYVEPDCPRQYQRALEAFGVPVLSAADLPPSPAAAERVEREWPEPNVPNACAACGTVVMARRKGRVLCDTCRLINQQLSPLRSAANRAAELGVDGSVYEDLIAKLEAQRPRAVGQNDE